MSSGFINKQLVYHNMSFNITAYVNKIENTPFSSPNPRNLNFHSIRTDSLMSPFLTLHCSLKH